MRDQERGRLCRPRSFCKLTAESCKLKAGSYLTKPASDKTLKDMNNTIPTQDFGRTGQRSSRLIFGGAALSDVSEAEADRVLQQLLEYGVNHIDTSVTYGDSEKHIGRWLRRHRDDFFIATKIDARTYPEAREELDRSLESLGIEEVDLLQMHELVEDEDTEQFLEKNGSLEVLKEAKEKGLARFVGVTSHGFNAPRLLHRCVESYSFDSVLLPFNYLLSIHADYRADFEALRIACREKGIALQSMKSIARGPWGQAEKNHSTWYRPLEEPEDIARAVHWVMSVPELFLASPGDIDLLPLVLQAASDYDTTPERSEMEEMRRRLEMSIPAQAQWPRVGLH